MPASPRGWCSGASSANPAISSRTAALSRAGPVNRPPPCTIRWPTASIRGNRSTNPLMSSVSCRPDHRSMVVESMIPPVSSSSASLRLDEPAFTTSTCMSVRPDPVADLGEVLAVGAGPDVVAGPLVDHPLAQQRRAGTETGHAVEHVDHQPEPVHVVDDQHVERRRGGAFLLVAADVDVVVVAPAVGEAVDQPRVAVVGEEHRLVGGE